MSVFKGRTSVIELTPNDFDNNGRIKHKALNGGKQGMFCGTCSWCGHCVRLAEPYSKAARMLGTSFPMFNLDCNKYSEFSSKLGIKGYPTIKYINRDGKLGKDYSADRTVEAILDDICSKAKQCAR